MNLYSYFSSHPLTLLTALFVTSPAAPWTRTLHPSVQWPYCKQPCAPPSTSSPPSPAMSWRRRCCSSVQPWCTARSGSSSSAATSPTEEVSVSPSAFGTSRNSEAAGGASRWAVELTSWWICSCLWQGWNYFFSKVKYRQDDTHKFVSEL